jgi:predicted metal-binding membrane protein
VAVRSARELAAIGRWETDDPQPSGILSADEHASVAGGARVGRGASIILGGLTLGAWVAVFAGLDADGAGIVGFVAAWTVMMVAMLPSAAPFVLLYRRGATPEATTHIGRRSVPLRSGPLAARVPRTPGETYQAGPTPS